MTLFLGIDGGGTKTGCVVGDRAQILGSGVSSGANVVRLGMERAREGVQTAIRRACEDAKVAPAEIAYTCIGAAGISVPGVAESLHDFIAAVVPGSITVVGDHDIAFEAAFGGAPGVLIASGTGSIAYGRNETGTHVRAGGHGFAISDEGSGHWIGRAAIARAMRAIDRGESTRLPDLVMEAWQVSSLDALVKRANATPPPDFARLFPLVVDAAKQSDPIAVEVLRQAGAELAELASVVIERLWNSGEVVRVAMAGGVFRNSAMVRAHFAGILCKLFPSAGVQAGVADPLLGALSLARKRGLEKSDSKPEGSAGPCADPSALSPRGV